MHPNMVAAATAALQKTTALTVFSGHSGSQDESPSIGRAELWSHAQFLERK